MAKIKTETPVKSISGKLDSSDEVTFYAKKGDRQFAWKNAGVAADYTPSQAQLDIRTKFKAVHTLVSADMQDPDTKRQWQEQADQSNGRYTTARGISFAHHWTTFQPAPQP